MLMKLSNTIMCLFRPSKQYEGVWPIQVYVLKFFFLLMLVLVAPEAWTVLTTHRGAWNNEIAIAWCSVAAYTTLSGLGIFHPLKLLPIMLFMFLYKGLWLGFVAFPLWKNGQLAGSEAEGWTQMFIVMIVPLVFTPWKFIYRRYLLW